MGYPQVAANGLLPVRDVPNCLMVPELGQAREHLLVLLRSDGHVFGRNLDIRNCPRTLELLFHFNKFSGVRPPSCDVLKVIRELRFHWGSHYSKVTVVAADSARSVDRSDGHGLRRGVPSRLP